MSKVFVLSLFIFLFISASAQKRTNPRERIVADRNDPAYLEKIWVKQKKAGTALTIASSALVVAGSALKIYGAKKGNAPDSEDWAGFGEQVLGIGGISVGVAAVGVGVPLLFRSQANKKRLMNLQPSAFIHTIKYPNNLYRHPEIGFKLSF